VFNQIRQAISVNVLVATQATGVKALLMSVLLIHALTVAHVPSLKPVGLFVLVVKNLSLFMVPYVKIAFT